MKKVVMARKVPLKEAYRSFDIAYWQAQTSSARAAAAWELVVYAERRKGNFDELTLQRDVAVLKRIKG